MAGCYTCHLPDKDSKKHPYQNPKMCISELTRCGSYLPDTYACINKNGRGATSGKSEEIVVGLD